MAELLDFQDLNQLLATMIGAPRDLRESLTTWGIDPKDFGDFMLKVTRISTETGLDDGSDLMRTRMNNLILGFCFGIRVAHEIALRKEVKNNEC